MKLFITSLLIVACFISCSKKNDIKPGTPAATATKVSADDSIHTVSFNVKPQVVYTSVSGNNLVMKFDENVDLLFTPDGYAKTSAIHLTEDFTASQLSGVDFTTVAEGGNVTSNWVDDNLNNVILKTVTDTVINNVKMVKVNVHRPFTFSKSYDSALSATNWQTFLVSKNDDVISFTSYSYYNLVVYPKTVVKAKVVYTK